MFQRPICSLWGRKESARGLGPRVKRVFAKFPKRRLYKAWNSFNESTRSWECFISETKDRKACIVCRIHRGRIRLRLCVLSGKLQNNRLVRNAYDRGPQNSAPPWYHISYPWWWTNPLAYIKCIVGLPLDPLRQSHRLECLPLYLRKRLGNLCTREYCIHSLRQTMNLERWSCRHVSGSLQENVWCNLWY